MRDEAIDARSEQLSAKWRGYVTGMEAEAETDPDRYRQLYVDGKIKGIGYCADDLKKLLTVSTSEWQPISAAPKDGTLIFVHAPARDGLPEMVSLCRWHPDVGFCIDELREPSHWMPLPSPHKGARPEQKDQEVARVDRSAPLAEQRATASQNEAAPEHELKCWPQYFSEVIAGRKRFEIRRNDRNFKVGDSVLLNEYDLTSGYTGRSARFQISYLTAFAQDTGWVVFGLGSPETPCE